MIQEVQFSFFLLDPSPEVEWERLLRSFSLAFTRRDGVISTNDLFPYLRKKLTLFRTVDQELGKRNVLILDGSSHLRKKCVEWVKNEVWTRVTLGLNCSLCPEVITKSPGARFELATNGLTVHCSTTELTRNMLAYKKKCYHTPSNLFPASVLSRRRKAPL